MGRRAVSIALVAVVMLALAAYLRQRGLRRAPATPQVTAGSTSDSEEQAQLGRTGQREEAGPAPSRAQAEVATLGEGDRGLRREPFAPDIRVSPPSGVFKERGYTEQVRDYGLRVVPALRSSERFTIDFSLRRAMPGTDNQVLATQNRSVLCNQELGVFRVQPVQATDTFRAEEASLERWRAKSVPEPLGKVSLQPVQVPGANNSRVTAFTGIVDPAPLGGQPGTIRAEVSVFLGDREFTQIFQFIFTGDAPGDISGISSHRSDTSGVTLNLALNVRREGSYAFEARIWNEAGEAVALVKSASALSIGPQTTALVLGGAFVRDAMPPGRYRVTDVEGALELRGAAQPTVALVPWRGEYWFDITPDDATRPATHNVRRDALPRPRVEPLKR